MTEVQLGYKLNDFLFSADNVFHDDKLKFNAQPLEVVDTNPSDIKDNKTDEIKLFFNNSKTLTYYKWTKVVSSSNSQ